jgi:PleD family two-component response regulator
LCSDVQSPERLFDETAPSRTAGRRPAHEATAARAAARIERRAPRRAVLVVDDDARNTRADDVARESDMDVISATNGRQAIEMILATPDLSVY